MTDVQFNYFHNSGCSDDKHFTFVPQTGSQPKDYF